MPSGVVSVTLRLGASIPVTFAVVVYLVVSLTRPGALMTSVDPFPSSLLLHAVNESAAKIKAGAANFSVVLFICYDASFNAGQKPTRMDGCMKLDLGPLGGYPIRRNANTIDHASVTGAALESSAGVSRSVSTLEGL